MKSASSCGFPRRILGSRRVDEVAIPPVCRLLSSTSTSSAPISTPLPTPKIDEAAEVGWGPFRGAPTPLASGGVDGVDGVDKVGLSTCLSPRNLLAVG